MTTRRSTWLKSSYSAQNGECVEVCHDGGETLIRDSKVLGGPLLNFSAGAWGRFLGTVTREPGTAEPYEGCSART